MDFLLDTTVLIDVLRPRNRRREFLAQLLRDGHTLSTSVLNVAELYCRMLPSEEARTEAFLGGLRCFDLTPSAARLAGHLKGYGSRKGRTLALADTIIAAVAIENDCHLLTDNPRDFPMPNLKLFPLP